MSKKLYEFSAMVNCHLVVAADNEKAAREEIKTYERAWFETGDAGEVTDIELIDIRNPKSTDLNDEAHVIA
jgi:hypothetical protein